MTFIPDRTASFIPDSEQQPIESNNPIIPTSIDRAKEIGKLAISGLKSMPGFNEYRYFSEGVPAGVKGFVQGATLDTVGTTPPPSQPEFNAAPSDYARYGAQIGHFIGSALPILGAEKVAATMIPQLAAKFGMGVVQQAIANAGLTGLIYGSAKGAVQGKPPSETINNAVQDAAVFGGLGAVGQGLGALREGRAQTAEDNANYFLNTPNKISADRLKSGEYSMDMEGKVARNGGDPTLGKAYLDMPELKNAGSKLEAFNRSQFEIGKIENQVRGQMETLDQGNGITLDGVVDRKVFNNVMNDILPELERYDPRSAALIRKVQSSPNVTDLDALELRRILDSYVGNKYLSSDVSAQTDAIKSIANGLREAISNQYPDLADMLSKQHDLLQIRDSLAPYTVSKSRIGDVSSIPAYIRDKLRGNIGLTQAANSAFGQPSQTLAPAVGLGAKTLSQELLDKYRSNNGGK